MFHGDTILCTGLKRYREDSKHDLEAYDKRKPVCGGEGKGCSPLTSWFTSSCWTWYGSTGVGFLGGHIKQRLMVLRRVV